MGLFGAMTSAVGGIRGSSYAMENISGNIANAGTTAFKRTDTSFLDLVPDTGGVNSQLSGGVAGVSRATNLVSGDIQETLGEKTFMAINGNGFFVVQKPTDVSDNNPQFDGVAKFTRRGDFNVDKAGFLVNKAGYFLEGIPIDPVTGNTIGNTPQVLQFSNDFLPAEPTTTINYRANLPREPKTSISDHDNPSTWLLNPGDFLSNPSVVGTPPPPLVEGIKTGAAKLNQATSPVPITGATKLVGAAGTNSLATTTPFLVGQQITINLTAPTPASTQIITFTNASTATPPGANGPNDIQIDADIATLLNKIDALTGATGSQVNAGPVPPAGTITLHSGTAHNFNITSNNPGAFGALGFIGTVNLNRSGGGTIGTGNVTAADEKSFVAELLGGGSVTGFNLTGDAVPISLRWAKMDTADLGPPHVDKWNLFYQVNPNASGTEVAWANVGEDFFFEDGKQPAPPIGISAVTLTAPTIGGVTLTDDVTIVFGAGGLSQFFDNNKAVNTTQFLQDGSSAGQLVGIEVNDEGRVVGNFSNGETRPLAQVSLVTFSGANFLKHIDGGAFEATDASGGPLENTGSRVVSGHVEGSNTDIAEEFTKLVVTQQVYGANTKVISTVSEMMQQLLNISR